MLQACCGAKTNIVTDHCSMLSMLQVLSSATMDPAVQLSDGGNLLHEIVDRQDVLVSAEHMSVLLHALRQRMRPEEFMGDMEAKQHPRDLQFMEHKTPDGLTVLYKVRVATDVHQSAVIS